MDAATPSGHEAPSLFQADHVHHHDPESAKWALAQEEEARRDQKEKLKARHAYFYVAGRVLIALLFVTSAVAKLVRFDDTQSAMANFGLSGASVLLAIAILTELVGGVMVGIGYKVRRAAAGLIAYLAAVTIFVHGDLTVDLNRAFALANLAFAGGLLMLVAHGPGGFCLDRILGRWRA